MAAAKLTSFDVRLGRPVDLQSSLSGFGRWGDDLLDRFDGRVLVRSIRLAADEPSVPYSAEIAPGLTDRLHLTAAGGGDAGGGDAGRLADAISDTFVVDDGALRQLALADPAVAELLRRYPGHVPVLVTDPLHALVRSISAQQVNLRWAATVRARLAERYGTRIETGAHFVHVLDATRLADATVTELREVQLTNAKARSVVAVARAARDGELRQDELASMNDEQLIEYLTRLPGIGRWSAEWYLARTLGRPRVVAGDLGVRKAIGRLYASEMPTEDEVRRLTEHWGAAATLAQALALHDLVISPSPAPAR